MDLACFGSVLSGVGELRRRCPDGFDTIAVLAEDSETGEQGCVGQLLPSALPLYIFSTRTARSGWRTRCTTC